jgi:DNA-binding beta-propeller fold protein YncE
VYIVDSQNERIQKFDSDGNFITKWGSEGYGDGQFWLPHDIAIDSSDNVYVVDSGNVHEKKDVCAL